MTILAFDLDGTIAPSKKPVPQSIADFLNTLGHIYIITGGTSSYAESATTLLKDKTVIGMADERPSIDLSKAFRIPKWIFNALPYFQKVRASIVKQFNAGSSGERMYIGGRSTIDIMSRTKYDALMEHVGKEEKIYYFFDCKWDFNLPHSNDYPMVEGADSSIRTNYKRIKADVEGVI